MGRTLLSISYNKGYNFAKMLAQLQKENNKNDTFQIAPNNSSEVVQDK